MKLRYLLPFYALLIAVSFCCRKISNEKEEVEATKKEVAPQAAAAMTATAPITGSLELDEAKGTINADIYINVPSADFKFDEDFIALKTTDGYKGVTFRYHDTAKNTKDDGNGTLPLHVTFSFNNDFKWVENDSIRVMSLDEDEHNTFTGLKPYFEERMTKFKNAATTYAALVLFNEDWNAKYPNNPVYTAPEESKKQHFLPRITKDDSILLVKLKK